MKVSPVDDERRALQRIRFRCEVGIGGRAFSPLENIDGTSLIHDSIDTLRASPLCWEGMPTMNDYGATRRALDSLQELYERALTPWDQFRRVQNPRRFMYVLGMGKPTDIDLKRPPLTFPAKIRREAKLRYFELMTTSRFSVEDEPSKLGLEKVHPPGGPITFSHLAGLASIVCVVRALGEFEQTLKYWADECGIEPGQPFMWLARHDRDRLEGILTAHMASPSGGQGYAGEGPHRVAMLVKSAEGWLALSDAEDAKLKELKIAVETTVVQTYAEGSATRKKQANAAAAAKRGKGKGLTPQIVADYFNANPGVKIEAQVDALVEKYKVSARTVTRRLQEARTENLVS